MKYRMLSLLFILIHASSHAQPFQLPVPEGWNSGIIPFPIEFAPHIPYKGEEYVRTAPRWREPGSETLWSYCYVWWINVDAKITVSTLEENMQAYYAGLVNRNIISRKIDSTLVVSTTASFKETKVESGDSKTFEGSVHMLDYLSLRPMILNIRVHVQSCSNEDKLAILFLVSPQPQTHELWKQFEMIHKGFRCKQ